MLKCNTLCRYDKSEKAKQAAKLKQALENPEVAADELEKREADGAERDDEDKITESEEAGRSLWVQAETEKLSQHNVLMTTLLE